jgi:hypothetical protein
LPENKQLSRLELCDNQLAGEELQHLFKYSDSLHTLKLAHNKIASYDEVVILSALKCLKILDLTGNPITKLSNYKVHMYRLIPALEVLDGRNRMGELVQSDSDEEEDYGLEGGEGGEDEIEDLDEHSLTDFQIEELKRHGISMEDFMLHAGGTGGDDDAEGGEDDIYGEEGEDEFDENDPEDN